MVKSLRLLAIVGCVMLAAVDASFVDDASSAGARSPTRHKARPRPTPGINFGGLGPVIPSNNTQFKRDEMRDGSDNKHESAKDDGTVAVNTGSLIRYMPGVDIAALGPAVPASAEAKEHLKELEGGEGGATTTTINTGSLGAPVPAVDLTGLGPEVSSQNVSLHGLKASPMVGN